MQAQLSARCIKMLVVLAYSDSKLAISSVKLQLPVITTPAVEHGWLNKLHNEIIYFNQGTIDVVINYTQCNSNDAKLLAQQSTRLQLTDLQLIFTDLQLNLVIWRASNTIYCESCVFSSYSWLTGLLRLLYLFINRLTDELDSSVRADGRCTADHWWWLQPQSCQHSQSHTGCTAFCTCH